jgi:catechol 2,3-dioxygenase-like lactoylglutathione lyase family enzyme/glycerol uptake facilitator-like aquaporin
MVSRFREHWPEYLMEAAELGAFMISAGIFTALIQHPVSPLYPLISSELVRRALTGIAMGLTAIAIVYSPWGKQSGAHFNPAVTLTFFRLGKVKFWDAAFYMASQFAGGLAGVLIVSALLRDIFRMPPVSYVATRPGPTGPWVAFGAEIAISCLLMSMVLFASNSARLAKFTGLFAGSLVATFITFESPFSGMSMNPARTFSSALPGGFWGDLWIYFLAPVTGMLLAVEIRRRLFRSNMQACPKLHHENGKRCIFCGRGMQLAALLLVSVAGLHGEIRGSAVGPIAITVADLDRSVEFYTKVLCFRKQSEQHGRRDAFDRLTGIFGTNIRVASLQLGTEWVQLMQFVTPAGRPYPADSRSNDDWFQHLAIVVRNMDAAYDRLSTYKVRQISTEPQTLPEWNKNAAGIKAFYFRDPDGHPLELISFPRGKGDPRWQRQGEELFLGIDHTAIAVEDTERSLKFYRDLLGFRVTGGSLNYGTEQEHLNHVFGSRVRITSLRSSGGPGIEFLEYLTPRDGRPVPDQTAANDLWAIQTAVMVPDLAAAGAELDRRMTAEDVQPLAGPGVKGFLVRDPDGHELLIRTP